METLYFDCEREYIEQIRRVAQQNILVQIYCGHKFEFLNLVDFYYRSIDQNAILMFLFICFIYPILFMFVGFIAEKYLAVGMQDLSKRFKLSPTLAAVTLIAIANGAPDVLSSFTVGGKVGGELISLSTLYGGFIFNTTMVFFNVIVNASGDIKLPKLAMLKELGFYFLSVLIVIIFALRKETGYAFIFTYLSVYMAYLITTVILEKYADTNDVNELEEDFNKQEDMEDNMIQNSDNLDLSRNKPLETNIKVEEIDETTIKTKDEHNILELIIEEFVEEEGYLINLIIAPLVLMGMLTVSYLENPLIKTPAKYVIIAFSVAWIVTIFEIIEFSTFRVLSVGIFLGIIFLILEIIKINKNLLDIFVEIISVFAAIAWIKIFSEIIIDFITFLAFYFNINQVILSCLLLAAGNSLGDFFGNGAMSKAGASVMAAVAAFSGEIFNNFVGYTLCILGSLKNSSAFDIFALGTSDDDEIKMLPKNKFIIIAMCIVILIIFMHLTYLSINNFTIKKGYAYVLLTVYGCFFIGSLVFGFLTSES